MSRTKNERESLEAVAGDGAAEAARISSLGSQDAARAISRLSDGGRTRLFGMLDPRRAAALLDELAEEQAAPILENLPPATAAAIAEHLPSDERADLLGRIGTGGAEQILGAMSEASASDARELLRHDRETAGGLMVTEYLAFAEPTTVEQVIALLRRDAEKYRAWDLPYAYVTAPDGRLRGVLLLRELLLADPGQAVGALPLREPVRVGAGTPLDELSPLFDRHRLIDAPVVDAEGRLLGVVRRQSVERAAEERASRSLLKFAGLLSGEELRHMPLGKRFGQRLSWLTINLALDLAAVSVIAFYEDTLTAVIALAVFLPIVSDMSSNAGGQAVAVSMRELTLGLVRPGDFWYVVRKELAVGLASAVVLGALTAAIGWVWKGSGLLGAVVGAALGLNLALAVCVGGTLPLLAKRLGQDPAMAAGPVLSTVTDLCGFFLALSFARAALPYLTG